MKITLFMSVIAMTLTAVSATNGTSVAKSGTNDLVRIGDKVFTREEVHRASRMASLKMNGGIVREANSAKGVVLVLNAQKTIPESEIATAVSVVDRDLRVQTALKSVDAVGLADVRQKIAQAGGTCGVAVVEIDGLPALLSAPEEGWSIVNVRALKTPGADAATLAARVRREVLRGVGLSVGGAFCTRGDFVMRDIAKPEGLDNLRREGFGVEMTKHVEDFGNVYGIRPWRQSSYRRACRDGWAPAPTNEFQKAIWDEIHAMPSTPMKILPESKRTKK